MPPNRVCFLMVITMTGGLAGTRSPVLGWSTWCTANKCGRDWCSSAEILSVAAAMRENGLQDAGFDHLLLDDCWGIRNSSTNRIEASPDRFPEGLPWLIAHVHELGYKVGVYTDMGPNGCHAPFTGSWPYYWQDARDFAAWGVDMVKFDYCSPPNGQDPAELTKNMSAALSAASGAKIWFHFHCDALTFEDARCGEYGDSFRVLDDHIDAFYSTVKVSKRLQRRSPWWGDPSGGSRRGWPDPDFIFTGGQGCADNHAAGVRCPGQSAAAYRSELGLWAIAGGQLVLAADPRNMSALQRQLLLNREVVDGVFRDTAGFGEVRQLAQPNNASWSRRRSVDRTSGGSGSGSDSGSGSACSVSLQTQLSHGTLCVRNVTYGCFDSGAGAGAGVGGAPAGPRMWAAGGCRGVFNCDGVRDVACESNGDGRVFPQNATCSCLPEPAQVWVRPLSSPGGGSGGSVGGGGSGGAAAAVLLFNPTTEPQRVGVRFEDVPLLGEHRWGAATTVSVRDLWRRTDLGNRTGGFSAVVDPHDSVFARLWQPPPL